MNQDPVKLALLRQRDALHEATLANDAAIRAYDHRTDLQLDLEQTEQDAYHQRMQSLRAERNAS